jgi:hypothetical protein
MHALILPQHHNPPDGFGVPQMEEKKRREAEEEAAAARAAEEAGRAASLRKAVVITYVPTQATRISLPEPPARTWC